MGKNVLQEEICMMSFLICGRSHPQRSITLIPSQLDCSPSLPTEPQLQLEAAKSTTGKLIVVVHVVAVVVAVPHTIISIGNEAISQLLLVQF